MSELIQSNSTQLSKNSFIHLGDTKVTDEIREQSEINSGLTHFIGSNFSNLKETICGYSSNRVGEKKCPKCESALENQFCDFVYVVRDLGMRVSYGPHGYFCKTCPTVVINTSSLKAGILNCSHKVNFLRPIGLDIKGDLFLFKEWNDKRPLFVINEVDEQIFDVKDHDEYIQKQNVEKEFLILKNKKIANKKKMQKKSKKKNRRK